jgi:predicted nuclease of predicted toxin-antitoxin system
MGQTIRFYVDEHISKAIVRGLRQRGVDVETLAEANMLGRTDEEHIAFARQEARVIFTQDDDFLRLHAAGGRHAGIVYTTQQKSIGEIIRGLILIYQILDAEDMQGHVEFF